MKFTEKKKQCQRDMSLIVESEKDLKAKSDELEKELQEKERKLQEKEKKLKRESSPYH